MTQNNNSNLMKDNFKSVNYKSNDEISLTTQDFLILVDQYIQNFEIDEITYNRIFKIIGTIRTDKKNIELLKTIFIS